MAIVISCMTVNASGPEQLADQSTVTYNTSENLVDGGDDDGMFTQDESKMSNATTDTLYAISSSIDGASNTMAQFHSELSDISTETSAISTETSAISNETSDIPSLTTPANLSTTVNETITRGPQSLAVSEADVKQFSYVTRTIVNPIICLFGFVSNSLGVGVLKKQARQQKLSIFWYLFALTLTDIMFLGQGLIDSIPRLGYLVGVFDADRSKYLMAHFRTGLAFFDLIFLHSARYIVVVMSFERLISVMNPLHVKNTWFAKYPMRIVVCCVIFNALIALPMLIFATVLTRQKGNITEYIFTFKHYDEFMSKWWIVEATFHSFVPMLFLVPVNIAIPVKLYRASKMASALNRDISSQQKKVTLTVMAITMLYIFLTIPLVVSKILQYVNPDFNMQGRYRLYFWFIVDLGRCLGYLNAANDFLVFYVVSNNYRSVFKSIYCRSCYGQLAIQTLYHPKSTTQPPSSSNDIPTLSTSNGSKEL